jgi:hypothetical protein
MSAKVSTSNARELGALLLLLLLDLFVISDAAGARQKNSERGAPSIMEYPQEIFLGFSTFAYPTDTASCLYIEAFLTSDAFFARLRLTDTPSGPQFRELGELVDTFPDTLFIKVRELWPVPTACRTVADKTHRQAGTGRRLPARDGTSADDLAFGSSLPLEITWLRGSSEVQAERISSNMKRLPFTGDYGFGGEWDYEILIRGKGVALTDQLCLSIRDQDRRLLARIIGGLATPTSRLVYGPKARKLHGGRPPQP